MITEWVKMAAHNNNNEPSGWNFVFNIKVKYILFNIVPDQIIIVCRATACKTYT